MSIITVYGIPNCNSVKKTLDWLDSNKIKYAFHNYKKEGITIEKLHQWCKKAHWELLFNTKGTTWKKIADEYANKKMSEKLAIDIMLENTSIIKRPVIETSSILIIGYDEDALLDLKKSTRNK
jgi:Spx/MgsR family transcriptional regulator